MTAWASVKVKISAGLAHAKASGLYYRTRAAGDRLITSRSAAASTPLSKLAVVDRQSFDLVSTDVFDTILLRDLSVQTARFAEASSLAAEALTGRGGAITASTTLTQLRLILHRLAYRAVSVERPQGDARLADLHGLQARLFGGGADVANVLRKSELQAECRHLTANKPLLAVLTRLAGSGMRIVAVSDTYYAACDVEQILAAVVGPHPIAHVYASSDFGCTKHGGDLFAEVARREGVKAERIIHIGDDFHADVEMARAAGCSAIHLPRPPIIRLARRAFAVFSSAARTHVMG